MIWVPITLLWGMQEGTVIRMLSVFWNNFSIFLCLGKKITGKCFKMFPVTIFLTLLAHLGTCCQCRKLHHLYLATCCHLLALCHLSFSKWPLLKGTVQPCPLQSTSTCTHAVPRFAGHVTSLARAVPCPRYTNRCKKTHLVLLLLDTISSSV